MSAQAAKRRRKEMANTKLSRRNKMRMRLGISSSATKATAKKTAKKK
jgi:hypothetical protein